MIFGPAGAHRVALATIPCSPATSSPPARPRALALPQGRFLRDGDTVEVEIDGLGTLINPVRSE